MIRPLTAAALTFLILSGCASATQRSYETGGLTPEELARVAAMKVEVTPADVDFMSGMIPHHAQAVKIASWAGSHGARADIRVLCERIVVAQRDEIALMRTWLADNKQPVPAADATHGSMNMNGMKHDMLMPGMLTDAELAQLDAARGPEFDRLFLTFMIRHHEGAVSMVDTLFSSTGAGQDETVFRLASDIYADQTTEIDRMQKLLSIIPSP
jgi:uncharacterized protein (DUF305 family)